MRDARWSELMDMIAGRGVTQFYHRDCGGRVSYNAFIEKFSCSGCAEKVDKKHVVEQFKIEQGESCKSYGEPAPLQSFYAIT